MLTLSDFTCKFDENLLGIVKNGVLKSLIPKFKSEDFADDVEIEGIRGTDDETIVAEATKAKRTLITNDTDFFFGVRNAFGTVVLRGGFIQDGKWRDFRHLRKKQKHVAILSLFQQHLTSLQDVRTSKSCILAEISLDADGKMTWTFREPSEDELKRFIETKKNKKRRGQQVTAADNHIIDSTVSYPTDAPTDDPTDVPTDGPTDDPTDDSTDDRTTDDSTDLLTPDESTSQVSPLSRVTKLDFGDPRTIPEQVAT